jgi:choline oxidase
MTEESFDYIVVGGGGSGAVLARSLADSIDAHVALIEAGPSDEGRPEVADVRRYREVAWESPLSKRLAILPPDKGNPRVVYPAGWVLGGSTSHNTCVWFRPPARDFAFWEKLGAAGWGPAETGPCFDEIESRVRVETLTPHAPAHRDMLQAARELGFPDADFSRPFEEGVGPYRLNKTGNLRQSSSVAYLHPTAALPKNLTLLTETEVRRLAFGAQGEVTGVETSRGLLGARREVVLAAGAFGSPKLLMLSGIGPGADLQALGLPVRRDLPGVGAHLLDHPACAVNAAALRPPHREGPWNYAGVLFARLLPKAAWPDIEMQIGPELFEQETGPAGYPSAPAGFCAYFSVNRAVSEGSVRLAAPEPAAEVRIDPNFFGDPEGYDLAVMTAAVRLTRRLFAAPALRPWAGVELAPGAACESDADLGDFLHRTVTTGYHPAGTCRLGPRGDRRTVVGPDLRVEGVRGLRIADASIFPAMVSVNIAPTCMMVGLRAARILAAEAR